MSDEFKKRKILPKQEDRVTYTFPTHLETIDGEPIYTSNIGPVTKDEFGRI